MLIPKIIFLLAENQRLATYQGGPELARFSCEMTIRIAVKSRKHVIKALKLLKCDITVVYMYPKMQNHSFYPYMGFAGAKRVQKGSKIRP